MTDFQQYAIRDPRNGKYCRKGARKTRGKDEEPHALFIRIGQIKTSITHKKNYGWENENVEYEIVPVRVNPVEDAEIQTYG